MTQIYPNTINAYVRDHPYNTLAKGLGKSIKWQFLMKFSTIYANVGLVSGSEKVLNCADVL